MTSKGTTAEDSIVHVVDDDDAVRDSMALLLASVGLRCEGYVSAADFFERASPETPGCVILDVRMPVMSGVQMFKAMARRGFRWPVLFMTGHGDVPMAVQMMREGAFDFLQKPFHEDELLERIQQAIAQDHADRQLQADRADILARRDSLTPRERDVLERMIDGQANKAIAIDLEISQRTVEQHRARVMRKMGARTLAQLLHQMHQLNT